MKKLLCYPISVTLFGLIFAMQVGLASADEGGTTTQLSNPSADITIDGVATDWQDLAWFADDQDAGKHEPWSPGDWLSASMAHDDATLYFAFRNRGPVDGAAWNWQVYFDADNTLSTGYRFETLGAEYLLQGHYLFRYAGTGDDWHWELIDSALPHAVAGNFAELALPRHRLINTAGAMKLLLAAVNGDVEAKDVDYYAGNSSQYFLSYLLDVNDRVHIDGLNTEWRDRPAFPDDPADPDTRPVNWETVWFDEDPHYVYLAYKNKEVIDLDQIYLAQIYIDVDADVTTGYGFEWLGAEYLVEGHGLWRYTGRGAEWSWEQIGDVNLLVNGEFAELAIDKSLLSQGTGYRFLFYGANAWIGGNSDTLFIDVTKQRVVQSAPIVETRSVSNPGAEAQTNPEGAMTSGGGSLGILGLSLMLVLVGHAGKKVRSRDPQMAQDKAHCAGNGSVLSKQCNAVLGHLRGSRRASPQAAPRLTEVCD